MVTLSILSYYKIEKICNEFQDYLSNIEDNIRKGRWQEAKRIEKNLSNTWEHGQKFFSLIVDHAELNDLEISLASISSHIEEKDAKSIMPEIKISRRLIENIKRQEKLSLENVF